MRNKFLVGEEISYCGVRFQIRKAIDRNRFVVKRLPDLPISRNLPKSLLKAAYVSGV